jgi:hypothetical protein
MELISYGIVLFNSRTGIFVVCSVLYGSFFDPDTMNVGARLDESQLILKVDSPDLIPASHWGVQDSTLVL